MLIFRFTPPSSPQEQNLAALTDEPSTTTPTVDSTEMNELDDTTTMATATTTEMQDDETTTFEMERETTTSAGAIEKEPTTTTEPPTRRRQRNIYEPLVKNATSIVVYAPNDYDLTLHYDSSDPLNYYNYATPGQLSSKMTSNGNFMNHVAVAAEFLPAQHRQEAVIHDIDYNIVDDKFHVTPFEVVQVPYRIYNTILRYAYIDKLKSSIVELPLDSDNYNLLIILPDIENNLDAVLAAMRNDFSVNLRHLRRRLRPHWIQTIVPKFHLEGNIVLTSDLMKVRIDGGAANAHSTNCTWFM